MPQRAYQRNAADPKQGQAASRRARDQRQRDLIDLREVLLTETGRRVIWRLLGFCGIYQTVLRQNPIDMAAAAGRQNVGQYLLAEVEAADAEAIFIMMREARAAQLRENRETDATVGVVESDDVE